MFFHWHRWFGIRVSIHEAVDKIDGVVFRCTLRGSIAGRRLEVPAWISRAQTLSLTIRAVRAATNSRTRGDRVSIDNAVDGGSAVGS
jgi:hypothetical protein